MKAIDSRFLKLILLKRLAVLDEFTRKSSTIELGRAIRARDVIAVPECLFMVRRVSKCIRSDN